MVPIKSRQSKLTDAASTTPASSSRPPRQRSQFIQELIDTLANITLEPWRSVIDATVLNEKRYRRWVIVVAYESGVVVRDGKISDPRFQEHHHLLPDIVRSATATLLVLK